MHYRGNQRNEPRREQEIAQQNTSRRDDTSRSLIQIIAGKAFQSTKVRSAMAMWVVGMLFMLLIPGLRTVTPDMRNKYEAMIIDAGNLPGYHETYAKFREAEDHMNDAKVWFWRFREPYKTQVYARQELVTKYENKLNQLESIREQKMRDAKHFVGLWSDFGLDDMRSRFWDAFEKGKLFAQRQTFYDLFFNLLSTRDEDVFGMILSWVFIAVMNFTTGLLGALFYFIFSLLHMVWTYQPNPASAAVFIVLGFIGGASVVASYLLAMYGMVASGVYVMGKIVFRDRLEYARQRQYIRNQQQR